MRVDPLYFNDDRNWISCTGKVTYDPKRPGMKGNTKWWCVIDIGNDLPAYYRWWLERERHTWLCVPAWGGHISVVRGEHPKQADQWKYLHGTTVTFEYLHGYVGVSPDKDIGGHFFWVYVRCKQLDEIRQRLGLPTGWTYHFTVGRSYY